MSTCIVGKWLTVTRAYGMIVSIQPAEQAGAAPQVVEEEWWPQEFEAHQEEHYGEFWTCRL